MRLYASKIANFLVRLAVAQRLRKFTEESGWLTKESYYKSHQFRKELDTKRKNLYCEPIEKLLGNASFLPSLTVRKMFDIKIIAECQADYLNLQYVKEHYPREEVFCVFKTPFVINKVFNDNLTAGNLNNVFHLTAFFVYLSTIKACFRETIRAMTLCWYWAFSRIPKYDMKDSFLFNYGTPSEANTQSEKLSLWNFLAEAEQTFRLEITDLKKIYVISGRNAHQKDMHFSPLTTEVGRLRQLRPAWGVISTIRVSVRLIFDLLKLAVLIPQSKHYAFVFPQLVQVLFWRHVLVALRPRKILLTFSTAGSEQWFSAAATSACIPTQLLFYSANTSLPRSAQPYDYIDQLEARTLVCDSFSHWHDPGCRWLVDHCGALQSKVFSCGPMMFADTKFLPKAQARSVGSRKTWQLGIFEVTPTDSNWLVNRGEGEGFFHDHFCRSFLELCVRAANEVFHDDVNFVFKSKRAIKSFHDHEYVSFLNNFIEKNKEQFVIFDPDANPWHTLEACNAVVAVPFTSLVDAALFLGLPAAFYDPSGVVQPSIYHSGELVSSYEGLCMWFSKLKNSPKQIADLSRVDFVYQNLAKSLKSTM